MVHFKIPCIHGYAVTFKGFHSVHITSARA